MLLAVDLHKDFIDIECIAESSMSSLQPPGVHSSKLDSPEANRFPSDDNAPLGQEVFYISMAEIKSVVEPDGVGNDFWWGSVAFICAHGPILAISAR